MATVDQAPAQAAQPTRLQALDVLRGGIMTLMALDHANIFIAHGHAGSEFWDRALPHYTSVLPFLTRLATHLCAPGFFFLMGASMALFAEARAQAGWEPGRIRRYWLLRGLILLVIQQVLENPAWIIGGDLTGLVPVYFGVLYALGGCMILTACVLTAPAAVLGVLAAAAVTVTQTLLPFGQPAGTLSTWQLLLLAPGQSDAIMVYYPILPWLGVGLAGCLFGRALRQRGAAMFRWSAWAGLAAIGAFALVRLAGGFGNIRPMEGATWLDALNLVKYPPSLAFLMLFLGLDLVLLAGVARAERASSLWSRPFLVFGRSPLFFYVVHLYLYATVGRMLGPQGIGLGPMFPLWLLGLVVLYPLCQRYGDFKQRQSADSLWRLF